MSAAARYLIVSVVMASHFHDSVSRARERHIRHPHDRRVRLLRTRAEEPRLLLVPARLLIDLKTKP